MTYLQMLKYLYTERPSGKVTLGLERIQELCRRLNNPQDCFRSAHVAGTNGKGSVTKFLSYLFIEHGLKTGSYFSPHLSIFKERILVNEQFVDEQTFVDAFEIVQSEAEKMDQLGINMSPSFFEFVTAMAFVIYRLKNVQATSIEVGLGGRYDATNVVLPSVSVIVTIDFDHMHILGDTLAKIAYEKAGIVKESVPTVCGETKEEPLEVIREVCRQKNSKIHVYGKDFSYEALELKLSQNLFNFHGLTDFKNLEISLNGEHQFLNASVALQAFLIFAQKEGIKVDEEKVRSALKKASIPGRFEVIAGKPTIIFDGAHNIGGAKVLKKSIQDYLKGQKLAAVIGMVDDKDKRAVLSHLAPLFERIYVTKPVSHRAVNVRETYEIAREFNKNVVFEPDPLKAFENLKSEGWETIIITGSLYLVGYLRDYIIDGQLEPEWELVR
ncbi:bifunctional folylpolyglutamate synthase/dihydrofolate synthase [Pseudothermotoga thermarum]|uniref:tetrahydrofolate synthase n=1 Tax=Pseudothermotoga thermarum DSM 5069 TaxID=688269 RepID=F7YWM0_9THEM|nr:folylpolyglutamate synthase/dihydrofolate synthase family protein [Pseudothermotoga thermarum]AEH52003.1 FolC bifunctional protein [Pseudothermotoga thermarum DSM 5069]